MQQIILTDCHFAPCAAVCCGTMPMVLFFLIVSASRVQDYSLLTPPVRSFLQPRLLPITKSATIILFGDNIFGQHSSVSTFFMHRDGPPPPPHFHPPASLAIMQHVLSRSAKQRCRAASTPCVGGLLQLLWTSPATTKPSLAGQAVRQDDDLR